MTLTQKTHQVNSQEKPEVRALLLGACASLPIFAYTHGLLHGAILWGCLEAGILIAYAIDNNKLAVWQIIVATALLTAIGIGGTLGMPALIGMGAGIYFLAKLPW